MKRIKSQSELEIWQSSSAFKEFNQFLNNLFREICGKKLSEIPTFTDSKTLKEVVELLDFINGLVDEIEPIIEDASKGSGQRYGNKSFRTLMEKVSEGVKLNNLFLRKMFLNSFGDPTRIDYGTGHELSFLIFINCLIKSLPFEEINYSWIGGFLIGQEYLNLVRKIQCKYSLEPAGSHGVWGLDDHQFIPFLLGSSQLIGIEKDMRGIISPAEMIKIQNFSNPLIRKEYLYPNSLYHIHLLKTRSNPSLQFYHHSPLLYDISGVESWQKIHEGLRRMYEKEVLGKFPVVQHLLFDDEMFKFS